ncbi:YibE/F family protein [Peptoclostridium acidaminophilum]|nr:YibE/F family protein [Peptoclostridium acidaminophilum]
MVYCEGVNEQVIDEQQQYEYGEDADYIETDGTQTENTDSETPYSRAKIINVVDEINNEISYSSGVIESNIQLLDVLITKGPHKGEKIRAEHELNFSSGGEYKNVKLSKGDEVLLYLEENEAGEVENAYVAEIARDKYLIYLTAVFVIALIAVGRMKGLKAILSLVLTAFSVIKILLPAILKGWDPVIVSVVVCVGVISATMLIISGFNRKTFSAVLGTAGGVIAAGAVALIIGSLANLTGFGNDETQMLMYIPQDVQLDFKGLLFAGIIIGTMGATMDVGMSIASAMHEIKENSPQIKTSALIRAGMNVGRDTMATMANTLILAYAGGSLHLMLLLMAHETPFVHIINWDMIASEVLRAIAGSIGIIFAIPITAFASAFVEKDKSKEKFDLEYDEAESV